VVKRLFLPLKNNKVST